MDLPIESLSVAPQTILIIAAACIVVVHILRQSLSRDVFEVLDGYWGPGFFAHCSPSEQ